MHDPVGDVIDRMCRAITEAYAAHGGAEKDVTFVPDAARGALAAKVDTTRHVPECNDLCADCVMWRHIDKLTSDLDDTIRLGNDLRLARDAALADRDRLAEALERLAQWDMIASDACADAPWARKLIAAALATPQAPTEGTDDG